MLLRICNSETNSLLAIQSNINNFLPGTNILQLPISRNSSFYISHHGISQFKGTCVNAMKCTLEFFYECLTR